MKNNNSTKHYQSFSEQQKWSVVNRVEASDDKRRELLKLGIPRSTYYDWKANHCKIKKKTPHTIWNQVPEAIEQKIKSYRMGENPMERSPARIMELLEQNERYLITESGVKSVLKRLKLSNVMRPFNKHYYIRPKAEKFLQVVCVDDVEFERWKPRDTYVLNFTDEASYFAMESRVNDHRTNHYDIIKGLKRINKTYGKYPKTLRLDNAMAHRSKAVAQFCGKKGIVLDFITKGCPQENWPVESWHRNLNQDLIYRNGFETIREWQKAVDQYRQFHNYKKRLRSDCIQRTPSEIAFAFTTPLTQARLKAKLQRKHYGQTKVQKWIDSKVLEASAKTIHSLQANLVSVSEMCEA